MTTLLQRMHDELVRRNYAATTIRTYLHALRTCERYHRGRRLDQLGATALRRYHAHLFREKKLAVGTVGLHVAALRFFFVRVLKRRTHGIGWSASYANAVAWYVATVRSTPQMK